MIHSVILSYNIINGNTYHWNIVELVAEVECSGEDIFVQHFNKEIYITIKMEVTVHETCLNKYIIG